MGTISDKLTYLNTTKSKIKDVINMSEAGITDDTFRSYPQKLYDGYINIIKDKFSVIDNMSKGTSTGTITDGVDFPIYQDKMSKLSTQDGTPTPSNPVEIKTVKGFTNIFNPNQTFRRGQYANGIWQDTNIRATTEFYSTKKNDEWNIFIDLNDTYKVGLVNYNLFDENYTWLGSRVENGEATFGGEKTHSFKINIDNVAYMNITFRNNNSIYGELPISNIKNSQSQLTRGGEQLPYMAYGTNNYIIANISGGNNSKDIYIYLNNNEIAGIGDYKDELIVDKNGHCWLNKKVGKVVLDGSEDWAYSSSNYTLNTDVTFNYLKTEEITTICNYYKSVVNSSGGQDAYTKGNNTISLLYTSDLKRIYIRDDSITNANDFKTWLNTHNIDVYYVLATPELIDLNYNVDLTLYEGTNTITNSENMDMEITYIKDTYE